MRGVRYDREPRCVWGRALRASPTVAGNNVDTARTDARLRARRWYRQGILRGRGHAAKEHVVPGVIVKCRDLSPAGNEGPSCANASVRRRKTKPLTAIRPELTGMPRMVSSSQGRRPWRHRRPGDDLAGQAAARELVGKRLSALDARAGLSLASVRQAQALTASGGQGVYQAGNQFAVVEVTRSMPPSATSRSSSTTGRRPAAAAIASSLASAGVDDQAVHAGIDKSGERLCLPWRGRCR